MTGCGHSAEWRGTSPNDKPKEQEVPDDDEQPSTEQLEEWLNDSGCEATDGCWVEPDGICEHGKQSWLRVLGMI